MFDGLEHGKYHVAVLGSPASLPISFSLHLWLVAISPDGRMDRYEVFHSQHLFSQAERSGYVYKNALPADAGLRTLFHTLTPRFAAHMYGACSGVKGSIAAHLSEVIHLSLDRYPAHNSYHFLPGPNSNTFVQWCLDQVPGHDMTLPARALGKGYAERL